MRDAQGNVLAMYETNSDGDLTEDPEQNQPTATLTGLEITDTQEVKAVQWIAVVNTTGTNTIESGANYTLTAGESIV